MGSKEQNFYNQLACRMGYEKEADEVQQKYLAKDYAGAAAAVPFEFIDRTSLIGPKERIAERMVAYKEAGVTTLSVAAAFGDLETRIGIVRTAVEAAEEAGIG